MIKIEIAQMQQMIFEKCRCLRDPEINILIITPNCDASQFKKWDKLRKKVCSHQFDLFCTSTKILFSTSLCEPWASTFFRFGFVSGREAEVEIQYSTHALIDTIC